ncbi:MAG: nucleoside-diphosphate sugar epimerase/dehydratase [Pseudomonadota bacterium]
MNRSELSVLCARLVSLDRRIKVALMVTADMIALPLCFLVAMFLRLGDAREAFAYGVTPYVTIALLTVCVFYLSGLYRAVIRFIDKHPLLITGGGLAVVITLTYGTSALADDHRLPRTALMIYWFIAFSYVVSSRLLVRQLLRRSASSERSARKMVAIFGAGEDGVQLARSMRVGDLYRPICFFDDKRVFNNHSVAGLKVFPSSQVRDVVADLGIEKIVLAIPSAARQRRRQVLGALRQAGVPVKIMGNLMELSDDGVNAASIRELSIEDLLGRDTVPPQDDLFARCVHERNVLVTGAGGSIGSEICRQIMTLGPDFLHLIDHSEFALYTIEQELRSHFPDIPLKCHLGSVCDAALVGRVMEQGEIDTVYHAAAYKHVPLIEENMVEGIRNNVIGAQVVSAAAGRHHVKTCVLISSDKAVRPTSVMGASKRIAELIFQAAAKTAGRTTYCMVRFGNVLGSSGSVVPRFQEQIACGGPITVTHPDITRYFMLIPEAAQLVMQAGAMATGGEVFVLDMGEPVRIVDLARTMIDLSGLTEKDLDNPHNEIEIRFVGLRPGEKLYEELIIGHNAVPSAHPRIMRTTEQAIEPALLARLVENLLAVCAIGERARIKAALKTIIVEFAPPGDDYTSAFAPTLIDGMPGTPSYENAHPH